MTIDYQQSVATLLHALESKRTASLAPRMDAYLLMEHAVSKSRAWLLAHPEAVLTPDQQLRLGDVEASFLAGVPMAYIMGQQEFWSLTLSVTPDTLIPRPETEDMVEWVVTHLPVQSALTVVDLGTGSGAIACALKSECPLWQVHATDQSAAALCVAKKNAQSLGLSIKFSKGSWWQPLTDACFDCIISNPPYIASGDKHLPDLRHEPIAALTSGVDGLDAIAEILQDACAHLNDGGWCVIEHGYDQQAAVRALFERSGFDRVAGYQDLSGQPRFVVGQKKEKNQCHLPVK